MLPREDVFVVYSTIENYPKPVTRSDLYLLLESNYTKDQINWAVGTMLVQGILKKGVHLTSDKTKGEPQLTPQKEFSEFVGMEQAK